MTRMITHCIRVTLLFGLLHADAQTAQPTLVRNGYVSGEHAVFHFDGNLLSIRYGSNRSGLGIATDWYSYINGEWRPVSKASDPSQPPAVHLSQCDPGDQLDISNRYPALAQQVLHGSKLKHVEAIAGRDDKVIAIFSKSAPKTQTGSILQISLLSNGETPRVIATADIGESRYCRAQWGALKDGTRDLIVFTLEPAGSSVSYAFQSFKVASHSN